MTDSPAAILYDLAFVIEEHAVDAHRDNPAPATLVDSSDEVKSKMIVESD